MDEKDDVKKGKRKVLVYGGKKKPFMVKETRESTYKAECIYTYEDYLNWSEDERIELIDGKIYYMSAPTEKHQRLLVALTLRFGIYLHGKPCKVYVSPFDVRIDLGLAKDSVVQPDLIVICDNEKLDERGLNGEPDLVIEIVSSSNPNHDKVLKYNKYLQVGVKEYWIVDPVKNEVMVNLLSEKKDRYITTIHTKADVIKVHILDGLSVNIADLFDGRESDEVIEVETARKEEQLVASTQLLEIAKKLLKRSLSIEQVAEITAIDLGELQRIAKDYS